MKMHDYKSKEVQKVITDLENNNKEIGSVVFSGWSIKSKHLNVTVGQLRAIKHILAMEVK
jgi:hypothetical protein